MAETSRCPVCRARTRVTTIPVRVQRDGHEVLKLLVPGRQCERCEQVTFDDEVTDEVVATLEEHTQPGDDIIFPGGQTLH
jgi:hypothetical protein